MEAQITTRVHHAVKSPTQQVQADALVNYYLYDSGGNITSLINSTLGLDLDSTLANINSTKAKAIQVIISSKDDVENDVIKC